MPCFFYFGVLLSAAPDAKMQQNEKNSHLNVDCY